MAWMGSWKEHRSNIVFFVVGSCGGGSVIGAVGHAIANDMHGHPTDWILFFVIICLGLILIAVGLRLALKLEAAPIPRQGAKNQLAAGNMPSLSALHGIEPEIAFDPVEFFRTAYYSPVTSEIEHNIKVVAHRYAPSALEDFYTRFIGIGYVATHHEYTFVLIFGSQLRALSQLNASRAIALDSIKHHYDEAAAKNPVVFKAFSFDDWCAFMKSRMLVAIYPTKMIELSHNGRDFLKYLAHVGKSSNDRAN